MNMIEELTIQNGYEIEIHGSIWLNNVIVDIKYPCGELVAGWQIENISEAKQLVDDFLANNPPAFHENCEIEYCKDLINEKKIE